MATDCRPVVPKINTTCRSTIAVCRLPPGPPNGRLVPGRVRVRFVSFRLGSSRLVSFDLQKRPRQSMKLIRFHRHGAIKGRSSRAIISTELITLAYLQKKERKKERKKMDRPKSGISWVSIGTKRSLFNDGLICKEMVNISIRQGYLEVSLCFFPQLFFKFITVSFDVQKNLVRPRNRVDKWTDMICRVMAIFADLQIRRARQPWNFF